MAQDTLRTMPVRGGWQSADGQIWSTEAAARRATIEFLRQQGDAPMTSPILITAGYVAYTGHVFTKVQAEVYNAAVLKYTTRPSEANANGAHNLFRTITETPNRIRP